MDPRGSQLEPTAQLTHHCPGVCKERGFLTKAKHGGRPRQKGWVGLGKGSSEALQGAWPSATAISQRVHQGLQGHARMVQRIRGINPRRNVFRAIKLCEMSYPCEMITDDWAADTFLPTCHLPLSWAHPFCKAPNVVTHSFDNLGCESLSFLALSVTHVFLVIQLFALGVSAVRWDP